MNDLITIIVNVYNGEKFIKKCLNSIINQTYNNTEILIINDGSTDKTLDICKSYKDKRIRIITTKNQGLSLSRNTGIDNAKGDYLYFVDADDFIELDTIKYLYNLINKYDADMATCECNDIYNYDFKIKDIIENIKILSNEEMLKLNLLNSINHSDTSWNKLIKKEIFNDIRFKDLMINDLTTTYKIIISSKKVVYSNLVKYHYYRNSDSVTLKKKNDLNRNIEIYSVLINRYNDIKMIYPGMYENDIAMMRCIINLYSRKNKELRHYLNKEKVPKLFRKLFKFRIFKFKLRKRVKYKIILFRISPKLYQIVIDIYLKIKGGL